MTSATATPVGVRGAARPITAARRRRRWRPSGLVRALVVLVLLIWSLGPVVVAVLTSLSTQAEVQATPAQLLPSHPSLDSYRDLLGGADPNAATQPGGVSSDEKAQFLHALLNTTITTVLGTAVTMVIAIMAGYAFSRLRFPLSAVMRLTILATIAIPAIAVVIPLFTLMADLTLINTQLGLILIYTSANAPLAVWLFYNYCQDTTIEPEQAALLDGCNRWQALRHIVLPMLRPGIAALSAIVMLTLWGQFFIPLLFAPTIQTKPVAVFITELSGKYRTDYPLVAAAGVLTLIPPAVIVTVLNRHIRSMLGNLSS